MKQDQKLETLIQGLRQAVLADPPVSADLRESVRAVLEFLASPEGRTDTNCRTVDLTVGEAYDYWRYEGLDGFRFAVARKLGLEEAEFVGLCYSSAIRVDSIVC